MPVNTIWRCSSGYVGPSGSTGVNTYHYRVTAEPFPITAQQVADSFGALMGPVLRQILPNYNVLAQFESYTENLVPPLAAISGVQAGPGMNIILFPHELPNQAALVIKKETVNAGRKYRGRIYLPFFDESQTTNQLFTAGTQATALVIANNMLSPLDSTLGFLPLGSQLLPTLYHRGSLTWTDLSTCLVRPQIFTQRRRRPGVGP